MKIKIEIENEMRSINQNLYLNFEKCDIWLNYRDVDREWDVNALISGHAFKIHSFTQLPNLRCQTFL